jgi:hypothetical protein
MTVLDGSARLDSMLAPSVLKKLVRAPWTRS